MTVTIDNEARDLVYRSRAMKKLGIKGFGDAENIGRVLKEALMDFDALAQLISVGLREPLAEGKISPSEAVLDYVDTISPAGSAVLLRGIGTELGIEFRDDIPKEGEQGGPP